MEIELLQLQTEKNVLNKLEGEDFIRYLLFENGSILPNSDISTPVIRIQHTEFPKCNYCKINELQRFYFIENITALNNGVYELRLRVDVLQSFKNDILSSYAYISRNEYEYNDKLIDSEVLSNIDYEISLAEYDNTIFTATSTGSVDNDTPYYIMMGMVR